MEADLLKSITAGGTQTKVVALGIGSGVDVSELNNMASAPQDKNVILVREFSSLTDVEAQLGNASCIGWYSSLIYFRIVIVPGHRCRILHKNILSLELNQELHQKIIQPC